MECHRGHIAPARLRKLISPDRSGRCIRKLVLLDRVEAALTIQDLPFGGLL